ncbi:MAG: Gfo/Idh/MocA family oxidoreductase [Oscillospiraceae bacterium]|nr:Gfo/Idh/MocA family oxidoreductase [Oscillospiraceae bacterium]
MSMVNWGVLGTAGIARGCTIPGMQQAEHCNLYAIAGRSMEKAQAYKEEFGFEVAYDSYEALLADPAVEAVYIPLPNQLHYEWAIKAMQAGLHVLCEKPLAPTAAQIEEMFRVAEENGVYLMEAFAYLHSPLMAAIKEDLPSLGKLLRAESAFITSDYDLSNIRMRRETYGGSVYDLGCYCTSQILWLLEETPEAVQAMGTFTKEKIDNFAAALLTYPDGKHAMLQSGMVLATEQDKRIDRLQLHGEKGKIVCHCRFNQSGDLTYSITTDEGRTVREVPTPDNYMLETENMSLCAMGKAKPHVTKEFSLKNAKLLEQILEKIGY